MAYMTQYPINFTEDGDTTSEAIQKFIHEFEYIYTLLTNSYNAPTANRALQADNATEAEHAGNADRAIVADSATHATTSDDADTVDGKHAVDLAVPPGAVLPFATTTAPSGWLVCNGQAVPRASYPKLFTAIGTHYGAGDGSTTFNLPDLQDDFVRGASPTRAVGYREGDALKSHTHSATVASAGAHIHKVIEGARAGYDSGYYTSGDDYARAIYKYSDTTSAGEHTHGVTIATAGSEETRPRAVSMLFCIKY